MDELLPVEPVRPPGPARRRILLAITLVLLAAFVVVAGLEGSGFIIRSEPGPTVQPTTAPSAPARLVYVGLDGTLNAMDAGTASVIHFPAPGAAFQFPAWSPDGAQIAAISTDARESGLDIFTPPLDAGGAPASPTRVYGSTDRPVFYAYWAPDSRSLAFLTTEPSGGIALRRGLADATAPSTTIRTGAPMYWQWVDPARLLVHSGGDAAGAFAGDVGLDGTPLEQLTVQAGAFRAPALSADGKYVAFTATEPEGARSMVVAAPDGSLRHDVRVFSLAAFEFDPAGDTLAFVGSATAGGSADIPVGPLRIVDPATGDVRTLIDGSVVTFFWAPDGKTIAAIGIPGSDDTKTASVGGGSTVLARADLTGVHAAAGVQAAASPTLPLFFVDSETGAIRSQQAVHLSDLFIGQVLPFFDQYALSHRFWSPDSRSLVLPIVDDQGVTRITSFFADGSEPAQLVEGQFASWSP